MVKRDLARAGFFDFDVANILQIKFSFPGMRDPFRGDRQHYSLLVGA
jgi:hypothetical protein